MTIQEMADLYAQYELLLIKDNEHLIKAEISAGLSPKKRLQVVEDERQKYSTPEKRLAHFQDEYERIVPFLAESNTINQSEPHQSFTMYHPDASNFPNMSEADKQQFGQRLVSHEEFLELMLSSYETTHPTQEQIKKMFPLKTFPTLENALQLWATKRASTLLQIKKLDARMEKENKKLAQSAKKSRSSANFETLIDSTNNYNVEYEKLYRELNITPAEFAKQHIEKITQPAPEKI